MPTETVKGLVFGTVRQLHKLAALRPLPDRISIYFHELEGVQWSAFSDCVNYFRDEGYTSTSIADYVRPDGRDKRLLVSFDDNYRCWHRALPLLDRLGVQATFYINTAPIRDMATASDIAAFFDRISFDGERVPLSRAEIRELRAAGHVIGAHTHSHHDLTTLPREEWPREFLWNKQVLEEILGEEVEHFSYPFGMRRYFDDSLRAYCLANGFRTIAAGIPGRLYQTPIVPSDIQRTRWQFNHDLARNVEDVRIDGRLFEDMTGRSPVG